MKEDMDTITVTVIKKRDTVTAIKKRDMVTVMEAVTNMEVVMATVMDTDTGMAMAIAMVRRKTQTCQRMKGTERR